LPPSPNLLPSLLRQLVSSQFFLFDLFNCY
jgi:hypothetical protein